MDQGSYAPPPTGPGQDPWRHGPHGQPAYGAPAQPPKSKKGLIITLIVVALFLCCCTVGGGILALSYFADQESEDALQELETIVDEVETDLEDLDTESDDMTETPLDEWYAWDPTVGDLESDSPTPWQQAIAEGIVADLYPEFTLLDTYVSTGGWSEDDQTYYMDFYNVRAYLTDDPNVEIGEFFSAWNQEGVEDDALGTAEGTVDEGEALGVLDSVLEGRVEYIFPLSKTPMHYGMTAEIQELLITVTEEWPGALITYVDYIDGDGSEVEVSFTTWDHYCTIEYFEGVSATYSLQDGQWLLDSYEWSLSEDE